jgi:uncharacterized RDD family membrane protein YckC
MATSLGGDNAPNVQAGLKVVGFRRRLLAYLIDTLILSLISGSLMFSVSFNNQMGFAWLPGFLIVAAYYIFFWAKQDGQTLGNRLLAIRVIRENGQGLDWGAAVIRYIGYQLSGIACGLGFLWIIWDKNKQGWHDKIAKTLVVESGGKPRTGIALLIIGSVCLLAFAVTILMVLLGVGLFKYMKENPQELQKVVTQNQGNQFAEELKKLAEISQTDADKLAEETFAAVNSYRQNNGMTAFGASAQLCAYARRRLEQLTAAGGFDDHKGLFEDTANQTMARSYFGNYATINESIYFQPLTPAITAADIINFWAPPGAGDKSVVNNKATADACVRANNRFVVLIMGSAR